MGVAMGVSLGVPFIYLLINRKRMRLLPLVIGIVAYIVINYLLLGLALGGLLQSIGEPVTASVVNAVVYALAVVMGNWLIMKYAIKGTDSMDVPMSYGLGYAFIRLIYISGAQMFSNISLATAVNNNGFEKVASTVEDSQALYDLLVEIENTSIVVHLMGGVEMVCFFCLSVAVCVMVWQWIQRGDTRCAVVAAAAELLAYLALCLYSFGVIGSAMAADAVYAVVAAAASVYAYCSYRKTEGGPKYHADPVSRF